MYAKRKEELGKETRIKDPKETLRRMYDKIIAPRLACRGSAVLNPVDIPNEGLRVQSKRNHDFSTESPVDEKNEAKSKKKDRRSQKKRKKHKKQKVKEKKTEHGKKKTKKNKQKHTVHVFSTCSSSSDVDTLENLDPSKVSRQDGFACISVDDEEDGFEVANADLQMEPQT